MQIKLENIKDKLNGAKTVAIAGHVRPDGDCIGSCLAMREYLLENFPELSRVDVYLQPAKECFLSLTGADQIIHSCEEELSYDLFLALDSADEERLGDAVKYLHSAKHSICYDHHVSNHGFADENYIFADASSASEVIFHVMEADKISKAAAEALYVGIINDTGVFQYSCTSPETLEVAAELLRKGIDGAFLVDSTFTEKTYIQNQILGRALLESILTLNGKVIVSAVRLKDLQFYGARPMDLDGIVSQLRMTQGVKVAIFLQETGIQQYKVSLRSGAEVNVSEIASYFGGGGHVRAAGCTMQGSFYDVVNNLTEHIEKQLKEAEGK